MQWYLAALKKYAVFSGRARRKEYWFFVLFNLIFAFCLGFIDGFVGTFDQESGYGLFGSLYSLAVLIPGIAVSIRRLHDTGRSGWWLLIVLLPIVGAVVLLMFMAGDSKPGDNKYGPNPKNSSA